MEQVIKRLKEKKEEGAALVIAIILLSAIEILGFALITLSQIDYSVATNIVRNEEALYSAEQGIWMGIRRASEDPTALVVGTSSTICSATYRGKEEYHNCGDDPYPKWEVRITNLGIAPPGEWQAPGLTAYRYLIDSIGHQARGVWREVKVEVGIVKPPKTPYETKQEAMVGEETRKLAFTSLQQ